MGEGQFTDAMAQQTALWHIAFRDQAVGLTHAAYSLAAVARNSHGGMKAPALQVGRYCQDLCIGEFSGDLRSDGFRLRCRWFGCDVDGSFEQLALVENGAGTDEGDQVWRRLD